MITFLRALFILVIASMLWVTTWASIDCPLFAIPRSVWAHRWFIATLFDAYWAFVTFYVWTCYKETSVVARIAWFIAIMLVGNMAIAAYCLRELFAVSTDARISDILTSRRTGPGVLGPVLAVLGIAVVLLGLKGT